MRSRGTPIFFGNHARPLGGWLHLPGDERRESIGLIICNPFGYEAICAHRTLRKLAETAADAGFPTLRFDYDGTGNSAGDDFDPDRMREWVGSIREAAAAIRAHAAVSRVCLLGLRLGALLAGLAVGEIGETAALIMLAPAIEGRRYLRELRTFKAATDAEPPLEGVEVESGGFALTHETAAALSAARLPTAGAIASVKTLIVDRADLPTATKWHEQLTRSGAPSEYRTSDEFASLLINPHDSVVPQTVLRDTVAWLKQISTRDPLPAPISAACHAVTARFNVPGGVAIEEQAVTLGDEGLLFAVVSRPAETPPMQPRKLIVLLNAGATHHIGPNRMYVDFARRWAARGATVMRLDISGIGESGTRAGQVEHSVYSVHALRDIDIALRYAREALGAQEIALVGLCSGAYHALKACVPTHAAEQVVMINPLTFFWHEGMSLNFDLHPHEVAADANHYRRNVLQPGKWRKLLRGNVNVGRVIRVFMLQFRAWVKAVAANAARALHIPMREDLGTELATLAKRNTRMLFVFASDDPGLALLHMQAGSSLRQMRQHLRIERIERANHTFTSGAARTKLEGILNAELL